MPKIVIYTDGACQGNPGPAGAGAILQFGEHAKTVVMGLGHATNNIAEVTAIKIALEEITDKSKEVLVYTDSKYAIGQLSQGWKTKANKELISATKEVVSSFESIKFEWVKGHSGHPLNEEADRLANLGVSMREGETKKERLKK